jgi:hypothetical protein
MAWDAAGRAGQAGVGQIGSLPVRSATGLGIAGNGLWARVLPWNGSLVVRKPWSPSVCCAGSLPGAMGTPRWIGAGQNQPQAKSKDDAMSLQGRGIEGARTGRCLAPTMPQSLQGWE